jgi:hypothetical protein
MSEVAMFTPLDSELFGSKASLAMLSDERKRRLFTPAELASIDAILPWTRMMRPRLVTLEDGQSVDLLDYALARGDDRVLKLPCGAAARMCCPAEILVPARSGGVRRSPGRWAARS